MRIFCRGESILTATNFEASKTKINSFLMEAITALLTPEQLDAIIAAYGTVAEWYSQCSEYICAQAGIIVEDLIL